MVVYPGNSLQNLPFGTRNANPEATPYANDSAFSPDELVILEKALRKKIIDTAPAQFTALKILFNKTPIEYPSRVFTYLEHGFGRQAVIADNGAAIPGVQIAAAVPPVPGQSVQQVIPIAASSFQNAGNDWTLTYELGAKAIITSTNAVAGTITVTSIVNEGLPAVLQGQSFAVGGPLRADGMDRFATHQRLQYVERYNFIQMFMRTMRWDRVELVEYTNNQKTNYLEANRNEQIRQFRMDMFHAMITGRRGETQLSGGETALTMDGMVPIMDRAGTFYANPTLSGLKSALEQGMFSTNLLAEGGTRFMLGTDEVLYEVSKLFKEPGTRYAPNDEIANLNLKEYKMGTMSLVPVPCELFREPSMFPPAYRRRLIVSDMDSINLVKMKGLPYMNAGFSGQTQNLQNTPSSFRDYTIWYMEGMASMEFNKVLGSFYMDLAF